jgi:hypothetical protein
VGKGLGGVQAAAGAIVMRASGGGEQSAVCRSGADIGAGAGCSGGAAEKKSKRLCCKRTP